MKNQSVTGHPNLILENGVVFSITSPPKDGCSVAIYGDRIMAVGPHQEVAGLASDDTERIDMKGRSVVPGFIDSHTCFATDCRKVDQINLENTPRSEEDLARELRSAAAGAEPDEWIEAIGYAEDPGAGTPSIEARNLDGMVQDRPISLLSSSRDLCILNTLGMKMLKLSEESVDISDVILERDPAFQPTGRICGKIDQFLPDGFPCHDLPSLKRKMKKLGPEYIRQGITSIHDIDVYRSMDMAAYVSLQQENQLPIRVFTVIRGFPRDDALRRYYLKTGMGTGFGNSWLRLGPMKFSVDGLMGRQNAAVTSPWGGTPGNYGQIFFSEKELTEKICEATEAGFQVAFHANGNRAIGHVLAAIKKAQSQVSRPIRRPRLHHCTLPDSEHLKAIKETDAVPIGHPHFIRFMGDLHMDLLGKERIQAGYFPFRSFLDHGIPAVLSSEPVLPLDRIHPMIGVSTAMTRKTLSGQILSQKECISLEEAITMYTLNPARAAFEEALKGSIEAGKLADLVVLEADIRQMSPEDLAQLQVDYTIMNGKVVFSKS